MLRSLLKSLRGSDWSLALDFLSPAFFEVVPTLSMTRLLTSLTRNSMDKGLHEGTKALWLPIHTRLYDPKEAPGPLVLKLYFAAILGPGPCFLDLRAKGFQADGSWTPQPWIFAFSPEFKGALQSVYQGFYEHEPQLFQKGLKALDLVHSEDLFLEMFGRVQDGTMVFRLQDFRESFHKIFISCKKYRTSLHPEFLPLGLLLFSLYEHAEQLARPLSPAEAWRCVRQTLTKDDQGASA